MSMKSVSISAALVAVAFVACAAASESVCVIGLGIVNYSNDADLAAALHYDNPPVESGERQNRDLAEQHYLAYLERCKESFQRAKIYYALAAMYSINLNRLRGETPDRNKAKDYYEKVLREEPERLGRVTVCARAQLVAYSEDVLRARMDVYEWFQRVKNVDDEQQYLPARPGEKPHEADVAEARRLIAILPKAEALNMVSEAAGRADGKKLLEEIAARFPGTLAGDLAEKALAREAWRGSALAKTFEIELERVAKELGEGLLEEAIPRPVEAATVESHAAPAAAATSAAAKPEPSVETSVHGWLGPLLAGIIIAVTLALYIYTRRSRAG